MIKANRAFLHASINQAAVAARLMVERGKFSVRKAAAEATKLSQNGALKPEAIRSKVRRHRQRRPKRKPDRTLLGDEIEQLLVELVIAFAYHAMALTKGIITALAEMLAPNKAPLGSKWCKRFIARHHAKITERSPKKSHKRKVLMSAYPSVKKWCTEVKPVIESEAWRSNLVFNIDETKALPSAIRERLVCAKNLTENQYQLVQDSTLYSLVSCISADGSTLFALYIFRKVQSKTLVDQPVHVPKLIPTPQTRSARKYPIYYTVTPKGYMTGELWKQVLNVFIELVGHRQGVGRQIPGLLFLDGCSSHLKNETPDILKRANITTIWFPSNTSHITQPADGAHFATYKNALQDAIAHANLAELIGADPLKQHSLMCSLDAFHTASSPEVVRASFKNRGIFPFDEVKILANAMASIGTERHMDASTAFLREVLIDNMFNKLKTFFSQKKKHEKRFISEVAMIVDGEALPVVRAPKKPRAKKTTAAKASKKSSSTEVAEQLEPMEAEIVAESSDDEVDDWDLDSPEDSAEVRELEIQRILCPGCNEERNASRVQIACTSCNSYFLCSSCALNPQFLIGHMQQSNCVNFARPKRTQKNSIEAFDPCSWLIRIFYFILV